MNFLHGAVIGPVLTLVQAELLLALGQLWKLRAVPGIHGVPLDDVMQLADEWIDTFCDQDSGSYWACEQQR